jgi:hypothetical protein
MTEPAVAPGLAAAGGYVVDAGALSLLGGSGSRLARSTMSGVLIRAIKGTGPPVRVPALALLAAALTKDRLAEHVARLALEAPEGAIDVNELGMITVVQVLPYASTAPAASSDVWHTVCETRAYRGWTLVTTRPGSYTAWPDLNIGDLS